MACRRKNRPIDLSTVKPYPLALVLALFSWDCPAQSANGLDSQSMAAALEEIRAKHDVPALAAAIVTDKGPVLIEVVGVRKRGDKTKAEKNDMFHLGSCTKAFTGWLAGWAVENGKLRWDSTLAEVFPRQARKWPDKHKQITLEQLVTHRSGFQADASVEVSEQLPKGFDHWPRQSKPCVKGRETKKQRQEFAEALGEKPLETEPSTTFAYSNSNQILAAAMIEEVSGTPWEDLLEEHIFGPLGMKETGQGPMATKGGPVKQPRQHETNGKPVDPAPQADNPEVMGPAGRLHMSLDNWGRFVAEILRGAQGKGTLLKQETYEALLKPPGYTKGCWGSEGQEANGGATSLAHAGSNNLNFCIAQLYPAENLAILVATNQGDSQPGASGMAACDETVKRLAELSRAQ